MSRLAFKVSRLRRAFASEGQSQENTECAHEGLVNDAFDPIAPTCQDIRKPTSHAVEVRRDGGPIVLIDGFVRYDPVGDLGFRLIDLDASWPLTRPERETDADGRVVEERTAPDDREAVPLVELDDQPKVDLGPVEIQDSAGAAVLIQAPKREQ